MLVTSSTLRTRLMGATAALTILFGSPVTPEAQTVVKENFTSSAAEAAVAPLDGKSIFGLSQVRRRNTGPDLQDVQPEQPTAPAKV